MTFLGLAEYGFFLELHLKGLLCFSFPVTQQKMQVIWIKTPRATNIVHDSVCLNCLWSETK